MSKQFDLLWIPMDLHRMIRHVEESAIRVNRAHTPEAIDEAYKILCLNRKFLYEYLYDNMEFDEDEPGGMTALRFR